MGAGTRDARNEMVTFLKWGVSIFDLFSFNLLHGEMSETAEGQAFPKGNLVLL